MSDTNSINKFFLNYDNHIYECAIFLRNMIIEQLPDIQEQLDIPARMLAFVYGNRYIDMICTIIPSKKGIKLGFYRGMDLPDPDNLLQGNGKLSRYIELKNKEEINVIAIQNMINHAYLAYKNRIEQKVKVKK